MENLDVVMSTMTILKLDPMQNLMVFSPIKGEAVISVPSIKRGSGVSMPVRPGKLIS